MLPIVIAYIQQLQDLVNYPKLAAAIISREGWDGRAVGAHGERGRYQFTQHTWRFYSDKPFLWACGHLPHMMEEQDRVFQAIMDDLTHLLPISGMPVNPYTLALAYNLGMTHINHREIPDSAVAYARAVCIYYYHP